MEPEQWRRVRQVLDKALEMSGGARDAFVIQATSGDDDLRREVESLLSCAGSEEMLEESSALGRPTLSSEPSPPREPVNRHVAEVNILQLPPYSVLDIATNRSRYRVVVVAPILSEVTVEGGERFPHPTHAILLDGETIKTGLPVAFHIDGRRVTTSAVERLVINPSAT